MTFFVYFSVIRLDYEKEGIEGEGGEWKLQKRIKSYGRD